MSYMVFSVKGNSIFSNVNKMTSLMKEQRSIEKTVNKYREYKEIVKTIADLKEMSKDKDV